MLEARNGIGPPTYEAELHMWDGMWHAFFNHPDLPDCREVFRLAVTFFDALLGMARINI